MSFSCSFLRVMVFNQQILPSLLLYRSCLDCHSFLWLCVGFLSESEPAKVFVVYICVANYQRRGLCRIFVFVLYHNVMTLWSFLCLYFLFIIREWHSLSYLIVIWFFLSNCFWVIATEEMVLILCIYGLQYLLKLLFFPLTSLSQER